MSRWNSTWFEHAGWKSKSVRYIPHMIGGISMNPANDATGCTWESFPQFCTKRAPPPTSFDFIGETSCGILLLTLTIEHQFWHYRINNWLIASAGGTSSVMLQAKRRGIRILFMSSDDLMRAVDALMTGQHITSCPSERWAPKRDICRSAEDKLHLSFRNILKVLKFPPVICLVVWIDIWCMASNIFFGIKFTLNCITRQEPHVNICQAGDRRNFPKFGNDAERFAQFTFDSNEYYQFLNRSLSRFRSFVRSRRVQPCCSTVACRRIQFRRSTVVGRV